MLLIAQVVIPPAEPKPIATTIAAIRANPKKFGGQVVRIHGYVNRCSAADCEITERPRTAADGVGDVLSIASDMKFEAAIAPLIPTYVEFDARVDSTCLINLCVGRPPVLTITSLRAVVSPEPPQIEN
jgi:hypothetical protein